MAITDSSKVDLLYKKLFGVAKTDTSTNKGASNESIASPALNRGDKLWLGAGDIPGTPPGSNTSAVQVYQTTTAVQCVADTTTVPVSSVYPTWKTSLTDWIPPEFGSNYFVKVYADNTGAANPASTGTQIFDSGIAGVGEWFFDYQSGVLNFIGGTIPAALTSSKVIYIAGYRYIGLIGVSNITVSGNTADEFARSTANTAVNDAASASEYANTGITLAQAAFNQGNSTAIVANNKYDTTGGNISGNVTIINGKDLTVTGNLYVTGNTFQSNVQSFVTNDPMLYLGTGNYTSDGVDIGFAAHYNDGQNAHTGLVRDSGTKEYYFFKGYTPELNVNNNIDINDASFDTANVNASYFKGTIDAGTF